MNILLLRPLALFAAVCMASVTSVSAQVVLALDFNTRANNTPANTQSGFTNFTMTAASGIQTGPSTRTFGGLTVTVANSGSAGYDDRLRNTPTDSGNFTDSLLLRDFIFSRDTNTSGLNVTITGLNPDTAYKFTVWSFDSGSAGRRMSDWSANGTVVTNGYTFNGSVAPTNNSQYQFTFLANTDPSGQIAISGSRNAGSVDGNNAVSFGVFLNALLIELPLPTAPAIVRSPVGVDLFQGDAAIFSTVASGTAPLTYYWLHDGAVVQAGASPALTINPAYPPAAGGYSVIVSNVTGMATSSVAQLTVRDVPNITTGLLAYWPLNDFTDVTFDESGNANDLWVTNITIFNFVDGPPLLGATNSGFSFDGTNVFLMRTNGPETALPAAQYPAYSIALWVKGDGTNQLDKRVFCESANTNNSPLLTLGTGNPVGTNALDLFIRNNDGTTPVNHRKTSLPVFDGTWHHVAWVDNNGFGTVFVDGVEDTNNFNYTRGPLTPNIDCLGVVYRTNAQALFAGSIDDVSVFRRSLTRDEVRYVMKHGPVRLPHVITHINVTNGAPPFVTLTVEPIDPTVSYSIYQTSDLSTTPIHWDVVGDSAAFRTGDVMTFQFNGNPQTTFYRIVGNTVP